MATRSRQRLGITLVEVLVTMAIIGVLLAVLLPAISAARGSARKAQCSNNLKQLAAAVHQYHQRTNGLPAYWGLQQGFYSDLFAGWLAHILPDLGQQVLYDDIQLKVAPPTALATGTVTTWRYELRPSGNMLPEKPQSDPYEPGRWVTRQIGTANVRGTEIPIYQTTLEGRVGNPYYPPRPEYTWQPVEAIAVPTVSGTFTKGFVGKEFGDAQKKQTSFPFLACMADPSQEDPTARITVNNPDWATAGVLPTWSLTNYVANAHAFSKFGDRIPLPPPYPTGTVTAASLPSDSADSNAAFKTRYVGLFTPPKAWPGGRPGSAAWHPEGYYNNEVALQRGIQFRTFGHIGDGLSNTVLFGEAMRRCDGAYRVAFLPVGFQTWEHAFGIEPSYRDKDTSKTKPYPGSELNRTFGHTLMFQSEPGVSDCNPMRTQGMHGAYLMVAMCDGSVRAISSTVTRKEAIGANATGRDGFDSKFFTMYSRSVSSLDDTKPDLPLFERPDGIWDMLLVPNDPPENVLSNTGEVGKDK